MPPEQIDNERPAAHQLHRRSEGIVPKEA